MYFFTADEHYGHRNLIERNYCDRPFATIDEMDAEIRKRHNEVVGSGDMVIHAGDFTLHKGDAAQAYVRKLNGNHIFLKGSHDYWLKNNVPQIWERNIEGYYIVVCHYAMRVWARSHYNSWQVYGHSHGKLAPQGKQWDVGVDANNFYPVSFTKLKEIMDNQPDNFNLIRKSR